MFPRLPVRLRVFESMLSSASAHERAQRTARVLLLLAVSLPFAACDVVPAEVESTARPVAHTPTARPVPWTDSPVPLHGAPNDDGTPVPGRHASARCGVGVVWRFVDEARGHYSQCGSFPSNASLHALECGDVEWALFESGCIPPARYLPAERIDRVWSVNGVPFRPKTPVRFQWKESFCTRYFDRQSNAPWGHVPGAVHWESYASFDAQGDVVCKPTNATCTAASGCRNAGLCVADGTACKATKDEHCEAASVCRSLGQCTATQGACVAGGDEGCRKSEVCRTSGKCSASNGACEVVSNADCKLSTPCLERGQCSAVNGACIAASNDDCRPGPCASHGNCVAVEGRCVPASTEQCERQQKETVFVAGECVHRSPLNCLHTEDCDLPFDDVPADDGETYPALADDGRWVTLREGVTWRNWHSHPVLFWPEGVECKSSSACTKEGMCKKVGHFCEPTAASCRKSQACKEEGRCSVGPENAGHRRCVAASDKDCARSKACLERDECHFRKPTRDHPWQYGSSVCVSEREIESECKPPTIYVAGKCRLPSNFDCSKSATCTEFGRGCETRVINDCNGQPCSQPYAQCVEPIEYCASSVECRERGRCATERIEGLGSLAEIETARQCMEQHSKDKRGCVEMVGVRCRVTDEGCAASAVCETHGDCRPLEGVNACWPGDGADCAQSAACRKYGHCGANHLSTTIECVPKHSIHCQQSQRCHEEGLCVLDHLSQTCMEPEETDQGVDPCAKTAGCSRYGLCTTDVEAGHCVARTRSDCHRSTACEVFGRCAPIAGVCRSTDPEHCRESMGCEARGRCVLRHGSCRTQADADELDALCQAHELCDSATCRATDDRSGCEFPSDAACARSSVCEKEGACSYSKGSCRPTTGAHCAQSTACQQHGLCELVDGRCAATRPEHCEKTAACAYGGRNCSVQDGHCGLERADPNICALTTGCRQRGACSLRASGYHGVGCAPAGARDCERSVECATLGNCALVLDYPNGGEPHASCAVTGPSHCASSELCARSGLCTAVETEASSANRSPAPMRCVAIEDAHCAPSAACKKAGRCTARQGQCVR